MKINITTTGQDGRALAARLRAMPGVVHHEVYDTIASWSEQLLAYIQDEKLSGQVLNQVTGLLVGNMVATVFDGPETIKTVLSNDTPYAMIHEYGGTTGAHSIFPSKAQALAFMWNGALEFRRMVNHPGSHIPERSYMRSALADKRDQIVADIKAAVERGLQQA